MTAEVPERLDQALVRHGLARSRGQARDLIAAGAVELAGRPARKPALPVEPGQQIRVTGDDRQWVSRAARKLIGALEAFPEVDPKGARCLDLGACTGGFTQVLLAHGAAQVIALDVGHDQLAAELVADPRVEDRSGTTARGLTADDLDGPVDIVVGDLSFISLRLVLDSVAAVLASGGEALLLVKPQFEVGRARLPKSGVVTAPKDHRRALLGVLERAADVGLEVQGLARSPLRGGEGNTEYLVRLTRAVGGGLPWQAQVEAVDQLIERTPS